jgi:hypothetical protein
MKRLKNCVIVLGMVVCIPNLYGDSDSYNRVMAKNRASSSIDDSSYVEIKNKKEFKEALESGKIGSEVKGNSVSSTYKVIDIKNVNLSQKDLKDIQGDRLTIGSKITGREKIKQTVNIKNSKISTTKKLNVGIVSSGRRVHGVSTSNNIRGSSLSGGSSKKKSRLDELDEY